jgi:energy-coupling factor transporter ATP-binding protein EcfA2
VPRVDVVKSVPVRRTPRVQQLEGLFDVPPSQRSERVWHADLPIEARSWNIGLIVGPSGCGKSTIARRLFETQLVDGFEWSGESCLCDGFPAAMSIKEITELLSSVGFSSPPSWLRPFHCLSNGEQFRATLARAIAECPELFVMDEFTSVVDRDVAKVGSAAVAKAIRRRQQRFVAVSCHYDIIDWLAPDWVYEPDQNRFTWRSERRRPPIRLTVVRVHHSAWRLFQRHHYLDTKLHPAAKCFVAVWNGHPVAFCSVLFQPHSRGSYFREHRTVVLPDYQGVGVGNALSEFVGSLYVGQGAKFCSTTSNPAMIAHRKRSPLWTMHRAPGRVSPKGSYADDQRFCTVNANGSNSANRITAGFTYVGPGRPAEGLAFGIRVPPRHAPGMKGDSKSPSRPAQGMAGTTRRGLARTQQDGPVAKGSVPTGLKSPAPSKMSTRSTTATTTPRGKSPGN